MSKSMRHVPKEIVIFGEKQFKETGASAVEILRVKASTIRKHFKQLKGIAFLVAVVTLDRVRVYFFDVQGTMLFAENIEHDKYIKVRKTSRLLGKFEKPTPPTPEEIRMGITEELRTELSRAMRRISREMGITEKDVPVIFVTRSKLDESSQSFAMTINENDEFIIDERSMNKLWSLGLVYRIAFLHYISMNKSDIAICMANAIAAASLKDQKRRIEWLEIWTKVSRGTDLECITNHLIQHLDTYEKIGFPLLMEIIQNVPGTLKVDRWKEILSLVHDGLNWTITTNEYFDIERFCKTLNNPKELAKQQWTNPKIHLAPRVVVNPSSLDLQLTIVTRDTQLPDAWATIEIINKNKPKHVVIIEGDKSPIKSFSYWLDLKSIARITGNRISNVPILRRILKQLGISPEHSPTFEATLHFINGQINSRERAVLERLNEGRLRILSDSLIGSLDVISSLVDRGHMILLPNLHHVSITPEYYVRGNDILSLVKEYSAEVTILSTEDEEHAFIATLPGQNRGLLRGVIAAGFKITPIMGTSSCRGLLRHEILFPDEVIMWGHDLHNSAPTDP